MAVQIAVHGYRYCLDMAVIDCTKDGFIVEIVEEDLFHHMVEHDYLRTVRFNEWYPYKIRKHLQPVTDATYDYLKSIKRLKRDHDHVMTYTQNTENQQ